MLKKIFTFIILLMTVLTFTACGSKEIEVKVDTDGGYGVTNVVVKKGEKLEAPIDPYKKGYVFSGWEVDGKAYDFSNEVKESITLKATYDVLSSDAIEKAEEMVGQFENEDVVYIVAEAIQKYNFNIDEFEDVDDPFAYIENMNDAELADILSFAATYLLTGVYSSLESQKEVLEEMYKEMINEEALEELYAKFIEETAYESNSAKFEDDKVYTEIIIPAVFLVADYAYESDPLSLILTAFETGYFSAFDVERNNKELTFKKEEVELTLSLEQLSDYAQWYLEEVNYDYEVATSLRYYYIAKMQTGMPSSFESVEELVIAINTIIKTTVGFAVEKVRDSLEAYNIIVGYESKIEELMIEFESVENIEDAKAVIRQIIDFKDQVIIELKFALPTKDDIEKLEPLMDSFMYLVMASGNVATTSFNVIANNLELYIDVVNALVKVAEDINYENYDIDAIVELLFNGDAEKVNIVKAEVEKLLGNIYDELEKITKEYAELQSVINLLVVQAPDDVEGMMKVLLGKDFDNKKLEELLELLGLDENLLSKEEIIKVATTFAFAALEPKTHEEIDEIAQLVVEKINRANTSEAINLLKPYVTDFINTFLEEEDAELGLNVITIIDTHDTAIKKWGSIVVYCGLYSVIADELSVMDGTEIFINKMKYLYANLTQSDVEKLIALRRELIQQGIMDEDEFEILEDNYLQKINSLIKTYEQTGTIDDFAEAANLGEIFAIYFDRATIWE